VSFTCVTVLKTPKHEKKKKKLYSSLIWGRTIMKIVFEQAVLKGGEGRLEVRGARVGLGG